MFHVKQKEGGGRMYIPAFWGGVIATILAEFGLLLVAAPIDEFKKKK